MPTPSGFQRLPLHIAETIACYCVSPAFREACLKPDRYKIASPTWEKLYNVSHSWRVLALQYFLQELVIRVAIDNCRGRLEFTYLPKEIKLKPTNYGHVKRVIVDFPHSRGKPYNSPARDISAVWPVGLVFPSAGLLSIELAVLYYQEVDERSSDKNERFYWLTQRIQTSMPQLQELDICDIKFANMHRKESAIQRWKADDFLSAVFGKVTALTIRMNAVSLISDYSFIQNGTGLASLECTFFDKNDLLGHVIAKSAATLVSMTVRDYHLKNVKSLVFDNAGIPLVYPRLQTFTFHGGGNPDLVERFRVEESTAPFPALQHLEWQSIYVFGDDTLFRGNNDTLRHLHMDVDVNLANIQQKHKMFADGKYMRLRQVSLSDAQYYSSTSLSPELFVRFATALVTSAIRSLSLCHDFVDISAIHSLASARHSKGIRHLSVSIPAGTLPDLLELVKLFPNMVRLHGILEITNGDGDYGQDGSAIDYLYTRHHPLSQSLKYWDGIDEFSNSLDTTVRAAIVLAILCPNFVSTHVSTQNGGRYRSEVEKAIDSGMYRGYKDKLQWFLQSTLPSS